MQLVGPEVARPSMAELEAQFAGAARSMTEDEGPRENRPISGHSAIPREVVGTKGLWVRLQLASKVASKKMVV